MSQFKLFRIEQWGPYRPADLAAVAKYGKAKDQAVHESRLRSGLLLGPHRGGVSVSYSCMTEFLQ